MNNKDISEKTWQNKNNSGKKKHKCDVCDKTFTESGTLPRHKKHSEEDNILAIAFRYIGEKPSMCNHCGKIFSQVCNMLTHKISHIGKMSFKCDKCV